MVVQFGDHFVRQPGDLAVIERRRQHGILITLLFLDLILLARDVAFILHLDLYLLGRLLIFQSRCERR
ncbi:Uncharacterised protein [Klebsiella pneumoniae]|nr:Uncharacterised protein [Klebsiella pneumoniae]